MNDAGTESRRAKKGRRAPRKHPAQRPSGPVSLRWDLGELPSSQHRAGLAGLALCVQFLGRKRDKNGTCDIESLDASGLTLRVDRDGMQALFDDIYAASAEEQERTKKFQKKRADGSKVDIEPKRTFERTFTDKNGKEKARPVFIYDQVVPRGALIGEWDAGAAKGTQLWLKLWRDLVWTTLRGVPATRKAYHCRAEQRPATDGAEAWDELVSGPTAGVELPSTYFLGAQARSAENVSFRDATRFRFLLHFWPFVVPIYVPTVTSRDGERDFVGYAIVFPEVANLGEFVAHWEQVARERSGEPAGYVPRDAVVDVAGEAGLDVARRTFAVIAKLEGAAATRPWVTAVDVVHVQKEGNNVRVRSVSRMDIRRDRANAYARVRREYWSAAFRRRRIISVLDGNQPWWTGFGRLCATISEALTIGDARFRHDCRAAFTEVEMKITNHDNEKTLEELIYGLTRSYVRGRVAVKYQLEPSQEDYDKKAKKVVRDAFLAVRSRTGTAFVSYFTGTLCSVPQRLAKNGYLELARALHDENEVERVRSLTLLALSAAA